MGGYVKDEVDSPVVDVDDDEPTKKVVSPSTNGETTKMQSR